MQNIRAVLQKVVEKNLRTLYRHWEATERGRGKEQRATYAILIESYRLNTGGSSVDAKSSGEVVRGKRLTKARGQRGESDGA